MLLTELKAIFHKELDAIYGKDEVRSFFFISIEHYLDLPRFQLAIQPEFTITKTETDLFFTVLEDLKQQKPIQYIIGETEFYGLPFKLNKSVLIPRPETEELVDLIIKCHTERSQKLSRQSANKRSAIKILDIGTGSGCIAISLAKYLPDTDVYALDVSTEALKITQQNATLNNVEINVIEADILNETHWNLFFKNLKFDVIVSNPPYVRHLEKREIKSNVLDNEPHLALFVDNDNPLQFYKTITQFAVSNLKQHGELYFEINQYLGEETKQVLIDLDFEKIELIKDLNSNDRILKGRLMSY